MQHQWTGTTLPRDICVQYFIDHPVVIGGPGKEVEIDENKFGKRKYNRGRAVDGHWVFGGMERGSGDSFLVEVAQRNAATLLPKLLSMSGLGQSCTATSGLHIVSLPQQQGTASNSQPLPPFRGPSH